MKTITNEWVCGNIAVKATLDLPDCVEEGSGHASLMKEGLTQILQRKPSSVWEKAEAGYEKRPEGFKRNSIPFSTASATALVEEFTKALPKDVKVVFETSEHIAGDSDKKPSKEAEELWTKIQGYPEDAPEGTPCFKRALATMAKFDSTLTLDDYDDERGIKATHAYLVDAARAAKERAKTVG